MDVLKIELSTTVINTFYPLATVLYEYGFVLASNRLERMITGVIRWADQVIQESEKKV